MKKILSLLLILSMMVAAFGAISVSVSADQPTSSKVVYVKDGGTGDGSSAKSPLGNLSAAYNALGDAGGRIVVCGKLTISGPFQEPVHTGVVTVTQNWDDLDYRSDGSISVVGTYRRYILNGPTLFENLTFSTTNKQGLIFICQNNPITMGEGISCEGFDCTLIANAVTILGGRQVGLNPLKDAGIDSHITVKSGTYLIAGMNRQMTNVDSQGTVNIEIHGGEVKTLYGGSVNGGTTKAVNITINGGRLTGKLDCSYGTKESTTVTINGGNFSACTSISGGASKSSSITVAKSVEADVMSKITGFRTINTSEGVKTQKIPEEVFGSGSFTGTNGATIPYRIYFPDNYDKNAQKTYPIFVYFHGNGSRGTDNKLQLGSNHALVPKVLNSGTDCIILAPQCPASSAWILNANYPGGTGFDPEKKPESPYLCSAIELINKIVSEEKVDTSRIYLGGGSNGAAACWSIISRNPNTVAAAIIQAGTGSTGAADRVAKNCLTTPIWTFHGDADTTLSVNGTREIVNAVKNLGGTLMKYTEMPGYSHDIWIDSANTSGLYEWLFGNTRETSKGTFTLTLDTSAPIDPPTDNPSDPPASDTNKPADSGSQSTDPAVTDPAPAQTNKSTEASSDSTTKVDGSSAPADTEGNDNGSIVIIIAATAGALVIAAVVVIILSKKKKA